MTIVAEVLVSKIVAEVESSSVVVPLVTPVVIGGGGGGADLSNDLPQSLGTASAGVGSEASRDDHVHAMPSAAQVGADPAGTAAALVDDLSGVSNAVTARTNLGLGDSATLDVGTTAGTVAAGDDPRLSDARTPTAHAASHGDGGADEVSLNASQVTTGTVATARLGSGTADVTTFLRGDQTWATPAAGGSSLLDLWLRATYL